MPIAGIAGTASPDHAAPLLWRQKSLQSVTILFGKFKNLLKQIKSKYFMWDGLVYFRLVGGILRWALYWLLG